MFCFFVSRMTEGNFLDDYDSSSLFHCGVTDSHGQLVYNFDERGYCADKAETWSECICVPILTSCKMAGPSWDQRLQKYHQECVHLGKMYEGER